MKNGQGMQCHTKIGERKHHLTKEEGEKAALGPKEERVEAAPLHKGRTATQTKGGKEHHTKEGWESRTTAHRTSTTHKESHHPKEREARSTSPRWRRGRNKDGEQH